jgi:hypothetical protein
MLDIRVEEAAAPLRYLRNRRRSNGDMAWFLPGEFQIALAGDWSRAFAIV